MTAAPKATSHGDGSAAGALMAFTGMSAANAGAAENASAATTDKTTFFITLPLFGSTGFQPIPFGRPLAYEFRLRSIRTQKHAPYSVDFIFDPLQRQAENGGNCCLFRRLGALSTESSRLLRQSHNSCAYFRVVANSPPQAPNLCGYAVNNSGPAFQTFVTAIKNWRPPACRRTPRMKAEKSAVAASGRRLLTVGIESRIDQRDLGIDRR